MHIFCSIGIPFNEKQNEGRLVSESMADVSIYEQIAKRTGGDIYIGVVGPVRTGKSTLIGRFLESIVLPGIENPYDRERTRDSTPQSASGKTVMTTEPKFVPDEAVKIRIADTNTELNVKLIDCVGYMVDEAIGAHEDGAPRMVNTPWSDSPIPFDQAAEIGTRKVIEEHSTIGLLVTTDGSFSEIPRESYAAAEEKVARELLAIKKPFAIVLNSAVPESDEARALAEDLEIKYGVPVALVSCPNLDGADVAEILTLILKEFPICALRFELPAWTTALEDSHPIVIGMTDRIKEIAERVHKLGDLSPVCKDIANIELAETNPADGSATLKICLPDSDYYQVLSECCGKEIKNEAELLSTVASLSAIEKEYKKIESALSDVNEKGYGIVMPKPEEMHFEEPSLVKHTNGYGIKIGAKAESIHMIRARIRTELSPVVGSKEQTEEVMQHLVSEYEEDPQKLWESNMFGKSLYDLMNDGLEGKLSHMPDESREKLGQTLEKIINEGSNGLICILL